MDSFKGGRSAALYFNNRLRRSLAVIPGFPLTVLEAPMGFGKTSAIREFLRASSLPAVWVSIKGPEPATFWRDFCNEFMRVLPETSLEAGKSLLRLGYPYDSVLTDEAHAQLRRIEFANPTLLVIDDLHWLPDPGFARLCELLSADDNRNLCIVLSTRDAYQGQQEILSLKGRMNHITSDILALTLQEIKSYYQECGISITQEEAEYLYQHSGGWISALYLYALHYINAAF